LRTLKCPLCGAHWKVIPNGGATELVWMTCVECEAKLPQQIHEADHIELEDMEGPEDEAE
jgi:hypothetical protein